MIACFDAVRLFTFILILGTPQTHFTMRLSTQNLQCLFECVCMPQYFRTLPDLDQGWTQCSTLDVVLYQVLRVSENSVKKVSVTLLFYLQLRYLFSSCVCF